MNDYRDYTRAFAQAVTAGRRLPMGGAEPLQLPLLPEGAPRVLIFSPHPDDECIIGGLALRLRRECGFRIVNVAVTQGSNQARQSARLEELRRACSYLGFDLIQTAPRGLENVSIAARQKQPGAWAEKVAVICRILAEHNPRLIFFPHEADWNGTHLGVHYLVLDALRQLQPAQPIHTVETEFWGQMLTPNLMVEISEEDLSSLVTATSFHVGEVQRNPYHLLLPPWMMDNSRRGAELVGGQGAASPGFLFATLYRIRRWASGNWEAPPRGGFLPVKENPAALF